MASAKQDMPPRGGYGPIEWAKKIPKRGIGGYAWFGGFIGLTTGAWIVYHFQEKYLRRQQAEMNDARIAVWPLFNSEQQRAFLKQLRINRDEEAELMKDVPGWKVGTLYGEPVYHNVRDRFLMPIPEEYYAHTKYWQMYDHVYERLKH